MGLKSDRSETRPLATRGLPLFHRLLLPGVGGQRIAKRVYLSIFFPKRFLRLRRDALIEGL